jgi:hypothetical protein
MKGSKLIEFFEFFDFAEKNIYIINVPSDFTNEEVSVLGVPMRGIRVGLDKHELHKLEKIEKHKKLFQKTIKRIDFVSGIIVIRLEEDDNESN